jgi:hypothetical protein
VEKASPFVPKAAQDLASVPQFLASRHRIAFETLSMNSRIGIVQNGEREEHSAI